MVVRDHDFPLVERARVAGGPPDAALDDRRATFGAAKHVRARVQRVGDDGVHARVVRRRPCDVASALDLTRDRQRDLLPAQPQHHLACAAQVIKQAQHQTNRLLHARIRIELDGPSEPIHEPDGQGQRQLAASGLLALGFVRALPQRRHFEFAHDPLEPQQQAVIDEAGVVDAIVIDQHDLRDGAQFDRVRPVAIVAREARGLERQHGTGQRRGTRMSLWKRGRQYWADFTVDGRRYRKRVGTTNLQVAKQSRW